MRRFFALLLFVLPGSGNYFINYGSFAVIRVGCAPLPSRQISGGRLKLLMLSLIATVTLSFPMAAERKAAADSVKQQGVVAYDVENRSEDGSLRLRLVRSGQEYVPAHELLELRALNGTDTTASFHSAFGPPLKVEWRPSSALLIVRRGNEAVSISWSDEQNGWISEGSASLFAEHYDSVEMIGHVIVDLIERGAFKEPQRVPVVSKRVDIGRPDVMPRSDLTQDTGSGDGGGNGVCLGLDVRGSSVGNTASYACRGATADAHSRCSNSTCSGCCMVWDCDVSCVFESHIFCVAGRSGRACENRPGGGGW